MSTDRSCPEELKDLDGHRYHVPADRVHEFKACVEAICATKFGSRAWHDANEELDRRFHDCMVG